MLSNAYFLAKFRFDTAENEPAKNLQNFAKKTLQPPCGDCPIASKSTKNSILAMVLRLLASPAEYQKSDPSASSSVTT